MNVIGQILAISIKELKILWQDRQALVLLFLMPAFFILVMSFALEGVFESGTKDRPVEVLVVNLDPGRLGNDTIQDLKKLEGLLFIEIEQPPTLDLLAAEEWAQQKGFGFVLVFPPHYTADLLRSKTDAMEKGAKVLLIIDPTISRPIASNVKGAIRGVIEKRRLTTQVSETLQSFFQSLQEQLPFPGFSPEGLKEKVEEDLAAAPNHGIMVETRYLRKSEKSRIPTATEQNVPAYAVFGVFFIVLTLARSILREKIEGTFLRLLCAPLPKIVILLGKLLPYYIVNLIQIGLMFAIGVLIFQMHLGSIAALFLTSLSLAASAGGLGLLVASLGRTESQVDTLSVLLAISLSALGGMMVPVFIMPQVMQKISLVTPHAWALKAFHDVIIRDLGVSDVLPEAGVLLGFALAFFSVALWRFRFY
jgi:ABC-2 type transport system permease protein